MRTLFLVISCLAVVANALFTPREAQAATPTVSKYFDAVTGFNFTQYTAQSINYRIAISSNATKTAPYPIVLQIVAPLSTVGWAGFAWGGGMTNQPLTLVWANGQSTVASSRRSTSYSMPGAYAGATYTILPTSKVNSTHLRADLLCTGCSQWTGSNNAVTQLDPASTSVTFAYALSSNAVTTPSSNMSNFQEHSGLGTFAFNLASAKNANFEALLAKTQNTTHTA